MQQLVYSIRPQVGLRPRVEPPWDAAAGGEGVLTLDNQRLKNEKLDTK